MEIGKVIVAKVNKRSDFELFVEKLNLKGENFIVKPNLGDAREPCRISAEILDWLFGCLEGEKVLIESYTAWRNELILKGKEVITPENAKAKWKWIKKQDEWFFEYSGIGKVLEKYKVKYINITEQYWQDRCVNSQEIKEIVENRFSPVMNKEMYSFVPEELYEFKSGTLISLTHARIDLEWIGVNASSMSHVAHLSMKNLFGLIPDPARYGKWHGEEDSSLPRNIIDINKVFMSLFNVISINEAIKTHGFVVGGKKSVGVDAATANLMGVDPETIEYLILATEEFGGYDEALLEKTQLKR